MSTNRGGGGGAVALIFLALIAAPIGRGIGGYHVARFYGLKPEADRRVIDQEIDRVADRYGLKRSLLRALIRVESGGNPKALSPVGARGITQVMSANAKRCGLKSAEALWDVVSNLRCGAQILSEEIKNHGDVHTALTVYNCGRVKCPEGRQYASKVLAETKRG